MNELSDVSCAFFFAPMEGLTTATLRNAHHRHFPGIDTYYTPFLSANRTLAFKRRELRDILPENNRDIPLIPQILGNKSDEVVWAVKTVAQLGYREINFNLGCPMPQVAKRGKGSGFLQDLDVLDRFFEEVFRALEGSGISLTVKTRIGITDASSAEELTALYNRYPIDLLIIHPRLTKDLYRNHPDMETFSMMYDKSVHPVCYNGDIVTAEDYRALKTSFPELKSVMIGRGLLENPALVREIKGGPPLTPQEIASYHDEIYRGYLELFPDPRQTVAKMKGFWSYLGMHYEDAKKPLKKIKKAVSLSDYEAAVDDFLLFIV